MKISTLIAVIVLLVGGLFYYLGFFKDVVVTEERKGPYTFAYVEHIGSYSGVGKPMKELNEKLTVAGFNCRDGIGIYYNDPKTTPKEQLRSEVGSIITDINSYKIEDNRNKFNFKTLSEHDYVTAEFPIRNTLSYIIGPMKVYPAMQEYISSKGIATYNETIEVYDMTAKKIIFLIRIKK